MPSVLHLVTWFDVGGAQETAGELCAGLAGLGWDAVLAGGAAPARESPAVALARRAGVRVETLRSLGRPVEAGADTRSLVECVQLIRRVRPDVVHTHSSKAGLLGRLAATIARVPVRVHTVHGWSFDQDLEGAARTATVRLERAMARVADAVVVVSATDRARGLDAGIGSRSVYRVIRSGVRRSSYVDDRSGSRRGAARAAMGLEADTPVVGSVTRFAEPKDHRTLLAAFALVHDAHPTARLVVVGDGPDRPAVVAEVAERRLEGSVMLLGHRDDVADLLPGFDLLAFASRREGLPRVVVEAVAAGIPVVSSDVGGVWEVLRTPALGTRVPVGDARAMADAVRWHLVGPRPSRPERDAALVGFDVSEMVGATDALYWDLLRG